MPITFGKNCTKWEYEMKEKYVDLMAKSLSAYTTEHILRYFNDVKREGLTEHGFPRLTVNMGILISHGKYAELLPIFLEMMDFCCKEIPNKKAANDFSVREIICCIEEIEKSGIVDKERIMTWRDHLRTIDIELTYNKFARAVGDEVRNWALFTAVSEYYRQTAGLCDSTDFIELQLCQQLRWLDENGMYRDNEYSEIHQPMVYDLVSRGLFTLLLNRGYRGKYYETIDENLKKSALLTLDMQSPNGEIPCGGRSNQFLHNEPWLCIIYEYEARRYAKEGNAALSNKFKAAASRALSVTDLWLSKNPIRHIKNRYPTETKYGCEDYAYFDKYMITTASMLYAAYSVCDDGVSFEEAKDTEPCVAVTSDAFHKLFLKSGGYGIELDLNGDPHYDASGLSRVHRACAPSSVCLSCSCPKEPIITLDEHAQMSFSLCSAIKCGAEWLFGAESSCEYEVKSAQKSESVAVATVICRFKNNIVTEENYCVDESGVSIRVTGSGEIGYALPAFDFDGEAYTEISVTESTLSIKYQGFECRYTTDGKILDLGKTAANRNGRYRAFLAVGTDSLGVKIEIEKNHIS